ncbi:type II toxin-antitoxin system RelE family toxin [Vibrio vulnificus]|uniref:type II toxin-antitoxin system RelE family toxin n=1 Tax=Vibrio vulnificus TaxID=672 RepID=UPI00307F30C2
MPQAWTALYHSEVFNDLQALGGIDAARVMRVIESSLLSNPLNVGNSAGSALKGCRLFKTDEFHILYQLDVNRVHVYVLVIRQESGLSGCGGQKAKTHLEVGQ